MNTLGKIIENGMRQKNMTMKQLGEEIGKTEASVSLYIANKAKPRIGVLQKISEVLEVDLSILANAAVNNLESVTLTPIPMENIVFDDYFPLYYNENLSAGTFMELLEQEPENVVHVPIRFQSKKKRLHAFKVNGESMNNILLDGTVVVAEDTYNNSIKIKDNSIVVAFYNGEATIKRFFDLEDHILLAPDSKNKSFMPIKINKEEEFTILGRVIWFSNPEDIMEKLGEI